MRKASNTCLNVNRVRFTFDGHLFNEDKGQGKARRYKAIVLVIVLLAILLTTAVLAHRRTAQEKMGAMTFSEMECDDFDFAGAESVPMEGFGEGR